MQEELAVSLVNLLAQVSKLDTNIILLAILIVTGVIIMDAISMMSKNLRKESGLAGLDQKTKAVGIDGYETLPIRDYVSDLQGLAGRPDAVIIENGEFIPIERKPLSKKLRDRHVAQLLVYMRLIEEFEGKRPPYGYLLLGKSCRRVKVHNSEKKQEWLQKMLDEMRGILNEQNTPIPAPHPKKCENCEFLERCPAGAASQQSN